ncbi:MAG: TatD family nuclease-associated radical SAM protein [Candidatus Sumerlaeaceae bacterium]|nr:TatD family nuclease-associated radical SAM protein [Candidatus Sumerlaeaceae bacterium]
MLIDTHAHLHGEEFDTDRAEVLARAREAGVEHIVLIGVDVDDSLKAAGMANADPLFYVAAGVHPHEAAKWNDAEAARLRDIVQREPRIVAVGEIGLDYHYDFAPREKQREAFLAQLEIAREARKPVVIHCREAYDDVLAILRDFHGDPLPHVTPAVPGSLDEPPPTCPTPGCPHHLSAGIMHCYFGSVEQAAAFTHLGYALGIGGSSTFKKAEELHEVIRQTPIEHLVLETDAPYMAPVSFRGKRNESAHLPLIAARIAELKGMTVDDVVRVTRHNALAMFQLHDDEPPAIAYVIRNSLYINLTNRCSALCVFCDRLGDASVKGHNLRMHKEPEAAEVIAAIEAQGGAAKFDEVVFCGYGEPTLRLPVLLEVARWLKGPGGARRVRLNTNGHSDLINQHATLPEMEGLIDAASISLNAPDEATYNWIVRPFDRKRAFGAVVDFIRAAPRHIPDVTATAVGIPGLDVPATEALARELGVSFRLRIFNDVG